LIVQKVRPSIRLLCGGVSVVMLLIAVQTWNAGAGLADAVSWGALGALFLVVAAMGMLADDGEEPGSNRFHELADPARTLSPEDFGTPAPDPVRPSRTGAA
jgi:hypothetical protein